MTPSPELLAFVQGANLPWLRLNAETGRLEFIIDNHLLSTYRGCSSYFMEYALRGLKLKASGGDVTRSWALDFGILFHKMMEVYYKSFRLPEFALEKFAIDIANKKWHEMKMDVHLQHKECQELGGIFGFAGMLIQYATQFKAENEKIRVLANEVSFGKNREVPIYVYNDEFCKDEGCPQYGTLHLCNSVISCQADIYLSGRIDILADDGYYIFPLDHKTMGSFRGDPLRRFLVDDGPTGYIYAMNKVLPTVVPEELILKRQCNRIQMNLISKKVPKNGDSRFKRFPLYKSDAQLEDYRQRVIGTCNNLLADLESFIRGFSVPRDTSKCQNWYFRECPYYDIHRQADKAGELATIKNGYLVTPVWDTEAIDPLEGFEE